MQHTPFCDLPETWEEYFLAAAEFSERADWLLKDGHVTAAMDLIESAKEANILAQVTFAELHL